MDRPPVVSPCGFASVTPGELSVLMGGGTVRRGVAANPAWPAFLGDWAAYRESLPDGLQPHWISRAGQLMERLFSGTEYAQAFRDVNSFAADGGLGPVRDFSGTVALFGPSDRPDPVMAMVRAGEPRKASYSPDEAVSSARAHLAAAAELRASLPSYERYEACDVVVARKRLASFEISITASGDSVTAFSVSGWREQEPLPPHFAEYVAGIESGAYSGCV